jgi:hypothetical protein
VRRYKQQSLLPEVLGCPPGCLKDTSRWPLAFGSSS